MRKYCILMVCFSLIFLSHPVYSLDSPTISVKTSGVNVSISWATVMNAANYFLIYAPYPYSGPQTIGSIDLGSNTSLTVDLWNGATFYVAVVSSNGSATSNFSNIELIKIDSISGDQNGGNNSTSDLNGCFSPDNSGLLSYYCFDGSGSWFLESWNPLSGCTGALESGTYQIQGNTLSMCDNAGCDYYSIQATSTGLLLDGDSYSESNGCK